MSANPLYMGLANNDPAGSNGNALAAGAIAPRGMDNPSYDLMDNVVASPFSEPVYMDTDNVEYHTGYLDVAAAEPAYYDTMGLANETARANAAYSNSSRYVRSGFGAYNLMYLLSVPLTDP